MTVKLDGAPFYVRTPTYSDDTIWSAIGPTGLENARQYLIRLGWPLPIKGSGQLVLDGVQALQEIWGMGSDRLTVDRWPGTETFGAMEFSLKNDSYVLPNFHAREMRDRHNDGWVYVRHEAGQVLQAIRDLADKPVWLHSATSTVYTNVLRGSTSHPSSDPVNGKPGSRHIWGEAVDVDRSAQVRVGDLIELGIASGIGHTRSGSSVPTRDEHVMHADIGGLITDNYGSNDYARTGGVEHPELWGYNLPRLR